MDEVVGDVVHVPASFDESTDVVVDDARRGGCWSMIANLLWQSDPADLPALRWHLHELDPGWEPTARAWTPSGPFDEVLRRLTNQPGLVARLAGELTSRCTELTTVRYELDLEIASLARTTRARVARDPWLRCSDCGTRLSARPPGVDRFESRDAYAR